MSGSVFSHGPEQIRRALEFFGGLPAEDDSLLADQERVGLLMGWVSLLTGLRLPVPVVRARLDDVDAAALPPGRLPRVALLRAVPDPGEVELPVLREVGPDGEITLDEDLTVEGEIGGRP